jgi:peroxiredoxin
MRFRVPLTLLAAALLDLPAHAADPPAPPASLALGSAAPAADVAMMNVDGKSVTLASARGARGLLVVFTCNHCPWAQAWESRIVRIGNDAQRRGLGVVAVNPNDPTDHPDDAFERMVERARSRGMRFPYVVDATSGVARAFGATKTPEAFLFDAKGRLVYKGTIDDDAKQPARVKSHWLRDAVDAVVAGRPVAVAETKAFGCSIKFRKSS